MTVALALAARRAIGECAGVIVALKWPNDLLAGERKLAGILAEVVAQRGERPAVVVGIGINLHWPAGFGSTAEEAPLLESATSLAEAGHEPGAGDLLDALVREFGVRYDALTSPTGRRALLDDYRGACSSVGRMVRVVEASEEWEGFAATIDDGGRLVVRRDGIARTLDAADVIHLR